MFQGNPAFTVRIDAISDDVRPITWVKDLGNDNNFSIIWVYSAVKNMVCRYHKANRVAGSGTTEDFNTPMCRATKLWVREVDPDKLVLEKNLSHAIYQGFLYINFDQNDNIMLHELNTLQKEPLNMLPEFELLDDPSVKVQIFRQNSYIEITYTKYSCRINRTTFGLVSCINLYQPLDRDDE